MSTLSVSGEAAEFQAFWCDTANHTADELGLIVLAFTKQFPANWSLAVTRRVSDRQHLVALWEAMASPRSLLGIPVPANWDNFELVLTPFSEKAVGAEVTLRFARPLHEEGTRTGRTLHIVAEPRIEAVLQTGKTPIASLLHIYQRTDASGALNHPATRVSHAQAGLFQLDIREPDQAPWPQLARPAEQGLLVRLKALGHDARSAIGRTQLWYASQAQLAPDLSTLAQFATTKDEFGFIPVEGVRQHADTMEYEIGGASPGDVLCLAPGLAEGLVGLTVDPTRPPMGPDKDLFIFELNIEGAPVRLDSVTLDRREEGDPKLLYRDQRILTVLRDQAGRIRREWSATQKEILDLSDALEARATKYRASLREMEGLFGSSPQFALCVALLDTLLSDKDVQIVEALAVLLRSGDPRLVQRLCSTAVHRAAKDKAFLDPLEALPTGTGEAPAVLEAAFDALFGRPALSRVHAGRWYDATRADPLACVALFAIQRRLPQQASIVINAALKPNLQDAVRAHLAGTLAFCGKHLLDGSNDLALDDAVRWACTELQDDERYRIVAPEFRLRIEKRSAAWPNSLLSLQSVDELRRAARIDEIAAAFAQIRDTFSFDGNGLAIPRFSQQDALFNAGRNSRYLIEQLDRLKQLPALWSELRDKATVLPWPAAALAALLSTLGPGPWKQPPLPNIDAPDENAISRAATEGIDHTGLDPAAVKNLFDRATSGFIGKLRSNAKQDYLDLKQQMNAVSGATGTDAAARQWAAIRQIEVIRLYAVYHLQQVEQVFERAERALREAQTSTLDSGILGFLHGIEKELEQLQKHYEVHEDGLRSVESQGRKLLAPSTLQQLAVDFDEAQKVFVKVSGTLARIANLSAPSD